MPNLIGMYWTDADPKLRSLGWTGFLVRGPDVHSGPDSRYRVLFQSPSAGQRVDRNGGITVRFGS
jgi:serine/threonine-protein kinase